ncbi:hypothetical protein PMZ80_004683 [Knufia obscura]|uniref:DH domain-containing protein n=1 Tax=Knufia obscura TaxID=1635080 RepID=A0ABR0RSU9_9EURO|nr:hypothetical protein PMZ80_004683 [Knufia obscura]
MPTALPEENNYYASPHRRQSSQSQSQTNLQDQVERSEPYSPSRSAVYLPSTTYAQFQSPQNHRRAPSLSNNLARLDTSIALSPGRENSANPQSSANPDDFYRHYPNDPTHSNLPTSNLHQDALRTLSSREYSQSRAGSNGSYSTNFSVDDPRDSALPPNVPGLKSRKASVKNLVAQINKTSTAEIPPVPTQSVPSSTQNHAPSPYISSAHISQFGATRKHSNPATLTKTASRDRTTSGASRSQRPESHSAQRRPLFGEVLPNQPVTHSAGYGIINPRRRTASESSPMHSPNPMFRSEQRDSQFVLSPAVYTSNPQRPDHRRTNSDMPQSSPRAENMTSPISGKRPPVTSRIPVSSRRMSAASDSGNSIPNSRTASALDRRQGGDAKTPSKRSTSPKQSLAVDQTPGRITSPGRRGKPPNLQQTALQQGAKSPSLRANIIAPLPKISPPLRSSRPRQPVSSASTAASRARMAEKFAKLQKLNDEKKAAQQRRGKPPELTDIDLNARRLRITRALTRSRESEELKARLQTGKRWEPQNRDSSHLESSIEGNTAIEPPQVTIDRGDTEDQEDYFNSELDREDATRDALRAMHGDDLSNVEEADSPTLGHDSQSPEKPSMHLQTKFLDLANGNEPLSAVTDATVATEATHIDPEPQEEDAVDTPSLLNHVMQMRDNSPSNTFDPSSRANDDSEDRADVESVNLVFRNTAYLDDEEAIKKGYRTNFVAPEPLLEETEDHASERDSWTSSLHEEAGQDESYIDSSERHSQEQQMHMQDTNLSQYHDHHDSYRDTMASDAYTIINIVLQEHSTSGIVDQQFADNVYQKVLETCPEIEDEGTHDPVKIEQLCLEELGRRDENERSQLSLSTAVGDTVTRKAEREEETIQARESSPAAAEQPKKEEQLLTLPSTRFEGHRHKPSLDSAEDWASTSPSIGDWMRFSSDNPTPPERPHLRELSSEQDPGAQPSNALNTARQSTPSGQQASSSKTSPRLIHIDPDEDTIGPEGYGIAIIRAPSHSPPPPPKDNFPSIEQTSRAPMPVSHTVDEVRQPRVPHRVASLGQVQTPRSSHSQSRPPSTKSRAEVTPWELEAQPEEAPSPGVSRLKKRKHIIKELVDTEFTYQRDMRVLCDIYKQTATAALTEDDIKVLFGNVEQVQHFARDFLTALKQTSKPSYADRKKDKKEGLEGLVHNSSSLTLASTQNDNEVSDLQKDLQKDRETRIGDAFEGSLKDMELVYTEYIRNRHAANQRLEVLQKSLAAQEWLKECRDNSSDITNAWNLDALLVKPVQRITKYPLLLKELIDATVEDHPDLPTIRRVLNNVTDINMRINDLKKHAEALDQVLNRKRGQSDVRMGLTKAFGRRAEKLRQHVGITDMYEDTEYDKLRISYDNNYVQLMVVANDCLTYEKGMTQWVNKMVEVAAAAEGWVDVGHSHHQQEESKLRHLAMIIRNVHNIALPDHLEHLQKRVVKPMTTTVDILTKFKDDPRGLLHKRDKRLVDYAQMKNRKDRGEKVDKKMIDRMDQWEALNTEAKERMRKLLVATAHLVQSCQGHLVQLQMSWMAMIQQKFSSVMGINLKRMSPEDIEKDWQVDFDYQEASALALGVCNGSLMLQAANMTSFLTPGSTLNDEDSPRQMSFSSTNKRSISLHSESSIVPSLDLSSRPSGTYTPHTQPLPDHFDRPYPYPNGRTRAVSTTSGKSLQRPEASSRTLSSTKHTSASANFGRPGTSPIVQQEAFAPPRLNVETHSPLMGSFQTQTVPERPASSNTFFSVAPEPSNSQLEPHARGSGVFSSALPMSESPVQERHPVDIGTNEPQVLFTAASVYEFNIDRARRDAGFPYLTYVTGEIFDVIGERGELWLAKNQDDPQKQVGWIWNKHFAKLAE